jgi:hypothetical protein
MQSKPEKPIESIQKSTYFSFLANLLSYMSNSATPMQMAESAKLNTGAKKTNGSPPTPGIQSQ